ncbi:MAG: hypothetical protein AAF502_17110 [Bacteroidota bacterium]
MSEYIPGIYNYCDRWCERCPMSSKCMLYAEDKSDDNSFNDQSNFVFWQKIENRLSKVMTMIKETIESQGYDWDTFLKEARETPEEVFNYTSKQRLLDFCGKKYSMIVKKLMDDYSQYFEVKASVLSPGINFSRPSAAISELQFSEAIEVVQWYKFFITAKLKRAIDGLHDDWSLKEFPIQNDANGTAKIALIAVDRSLVAWRTLYDLLPEMANEIIEALRLLSKIREELLEQFSDLNKFIRPGFDDHHPV